MKNTWKNILIAVLAVIAAAALIWTSIDFITNRQHGNPGISIESTDENSGNNKEEITEPQEPQIVFNPHPTEETNPEKFGVETQIFSGNTQIDSYSQETFDFGFTNKYTDAQGVITFRGNNFRDDPVYGNYQLKTQKFPTDFWRVETGSLASGSGYAPWSGSGWTGQPLIVKWDNETKQHMNIFPEKKAKENLVEVIYATMAGKIYFVDLDDGQYTREPMTLNFVFKGAGALDPRGYPIMYVGGGDYAPGGAAPKMFIINLLDCTVMKEYSGSDSVALRSWCAFDSSALVCAETDTLIYPCENGLIYSIRLGTDYNKANGKLSINPDEPVKIRITTSRSNSSTFWYGIETSAVFFGQYMFAADNGGNLFCIDMKNYKVIWVQDVVDDTNCTPVLEVENGKPYLYISTSLHWTKKGGRGDIPVFKIDAETGEKVWTKTFNCGTVDGTSGGVQGTMALGKNDSSDLIFVPLAHYPNLYQGGIAALDKNTGEEVWYYQESSYTWSSPCVMETADGGSVIINGDTAGDIIMLDAKTGQLLDKVTPGGLIEASPAVYNDMLVFGLRSSEFVGIKLS
ncbi:MAG: PQQ-like beta-propeller repeat protein [Clostridia bacterium]|nr:PQQ-like beta-propeller repeat protein [Clostridia bacterium]